MLNTETNNLVQVYEALTVGIKYVGVKFIHQNNERSEKVYSYKYNGEIAVGDKAVVESPYNGFVVVDVVSVSDFKEENVKGKHLLKWIVQRVDVETHEKRTANDKEAYRMLQEVEQTEGHKKVLKNFLKGKDNKKELRAVLEVVSSVLTA